MVMPFCLTNSPSTFMRLMTYVMKSFIGLCVVVYFDDILVYIKSIDDHFEHLKCVFYVLIQEPLFVNLEKCFFCVDEAIFSGFDVSSWGVKVNKSKIDAIITWHTPKSISNVRSFYRFSSFYIRFIKGFNTIVASLIKVI